MHLYGMTGLPLLFFVCRWSANMALGEPRVWPQHGDIHGAWASGAIDSNQFIEVGGVH